MGQRDSGQGECGIQRRIDIGGHFAADAVHGYGKGLLSGCAPHHFVRVVIAVVQHGGIGSEVHLYLSSFRADIPYSGRFVTTDAWRQGQ